jgi:hypothetical protein
MSPNEFLLYPGAEQVSRLPREELRPFIFERLNEQERAGVPDLERVMGLGQLARRLAVDGVESDLHAWLQNHLTERGYDTVGLFLMGFWTPRSTIDNNLVRSMVRALREYPNAKGARDSAISALRIAYGRVADDALGAEIRAAFGLLVAIRDTLQPSVRAAVDSIIDSNSI